jgi:hypothetical protein
MELLFILGFIVVIALLVGVPVMIRNNKLGRRTSSGLAGALGVVNELYQPSAKNSAVIVEEQNQAVKPMPSPEDKEKPGSK